MKTLRVEDEWMKLELQTLMLNSLVPLLPSFVAVACSGTVLYVCEEIQQQLLTPILWKFYAPLRVLLLSSRLWSRPSLVAALFGCLCPECRELYRKRRGISHMEALATRPTLVAQSSAPWLFLGLKPGDDDGHGEDSEWNSAYMVVGLGSRTKGVSSMRFRSRHQKVIVCREAPSAASVSSCYCSCCSLWLLNILCFSDILGRRCHRSLLALIQLASRRRIAVPLLCPWMMFF